MALIQGNMVAHLDAATEDSIVCDAGRSMLVKDIRVGPSEADDWLHVYTERKLVGFFRIEPHPAAYVQLANHLPFPAIDLSSLGHLLTDSVLACAAKAGHPITFPVAEGEEFAVTRAAEAGEVEVWYDLYEAGDIVNTMPDGSQADVFHVLNYGAHDGFILANGEYLIDHSFNPVEQPQFPVGVVVPARHTAELLALIGCPVSDSAAGANCGYTEYVRLVQERETLGDQGRLGWRFQGDVAAGRAAIYYRAGLSDIGDKSQTHPEEPLWFKPPYTFGPGAELNAFVRIGGWFAGASWDDTVKLVQLSFLIRYTRE